MLTTPSYIYYWMDTGPVNLAVDLEAVVGGKEQLNPTKPEVLWLKGEHFGLELQSPALAVVD